MSWKIKFISVAAFAALFFNSTAAAPGDDTANLKFGRECKRLKAETVRRIELPKGYHEGLSIGGGGTVWVVNGRALKIWIVDIASGKVLGDIEPVGTFTEAVTAASGGKFFVSDWDQKKIYGARLEANTLKAESEFSVAPAHPAGILWKDPRLYVITWTRGFGTKFHLLEMDRDGKILAKTLLRGIQEPAHLAFDGKNIWITSWYSRRVYRVNLKEHRITGYFPTPFGRATGITWDGEFLWVTGTDADLYQMKVHPVREPNGSLTVGADEQFSNGVKG